MSKKTLTKSQRKFVAREKARIRRQFFDLEKREEEIQKIRNRFLGRAVSSEAPAIAVKAPVKKTKPAKSVKKSGAKKIKTKDKK